MKRRLPIVLSVAAVLIVIAGITPLGQAASDQVVRFARNSDRVDGLHASRRPRAGRLLALNRNRKFPASVLPSTTGLTGLEVVTAATATDSSTPKVVQVNCPAGKRVAGGAFRVTGGGTNNVRVTEFYASTPNQWTVRAVENPTTGNSWLLTGFAHCVAGT
jgi:hypothetical protein